MERGRFITIEGIEGVGKSTNMDAIVRHIEAAGQRAITIALVKAITVRQEPRQAFAQQALFFGEFEVHRRQSPSMVLEMIDFWISFDPP